MVSRTYALPQRLSFLEKKPPRVVKTLLDLEVEEGGGGLMVLLVLLVGLLAGGGGIMM